MSSRDAALLRARFCELGLTRDFLRANAERGDDLRHALIPTREAGLSDDPAHVVFRAFFCDRPIPKRVLREALGLDLPGCGLLVERTGEGVVCPFHLRVIRGLYLFSDYLHGSAEAVMGAGETTAVLYHAARPAGAIGSVLDLGCGAGTLALLLAERAQCVVGADINARAVDLAQWNAAVNGIHNAEFRTGDTYAPVAEERFDLIVSQPPYYSDPGDGRSTQVFLHGGTHGDEIARRVVDGLPMHLADGGRAIVFTSWPQGRERVELSGHEVLQLRTGRSEPDGKRQSMTFVRRGEPAWFERFDVPSDAWAAVTPGRIDELIATRRLLHASDERLQKASLRQVPGLAAFTEGEHLIVKGRLQSLLGCFAIDESLWSAAQANGEGASVAVRRELLRRGILVG